MASRVVVYGERPATTSVSPHVCYRCDDCARLAPVEEMYYCTASSTLCCRYCVTQEIDSYYCPICLESMPSAEAMLFLNRCSKCFVCPSCGNHLSNLANAETGKFCLTCNYCRWSSARVGLETEKPDKLILSAIKRERAQPQQAKVSKLVGGFSKKQMEFIRMREHRSRRTVSLSMPLFEASKLDKITLEQVEELRASKEKEWNGQTPFEEDAVPPPAVPEDVLLCKDVAGTTSLEQRFVQVNDQPAHLSAVFPARCPLMTKRSKRCRSSGHFVIKPEINPSSIKFKIHNTALAHLPRITLPGRTPLALRKPTDVLVTISNPTAGVCTVTLAPHVPDGKSPAGDVARINADVEVVGGSEELGGGARVKVAAFNDIAFVDESAADEDNEELRAGDSAAVAARQFNTVLVKLRVTPQHVGAVVFALALEFLPEDGDTAKKMVATVCLGEL